MQKKYDGDGVINRELCVFIICKVIQIVHAEE